MIGIFIFLFIIGMFARVIVKMEAQKLNRCQVHKWVYDEAGHLRCEVCKKTPEENLWS